MLSTVLEYKYSEKTQSTVVHMLFYSIRIQKKNKQKWSTVVYTVLYGMLILIQKQSPDI